MTEAGAGDGATEAEDETPRVDLVAEALAIGTPDVAPLPMTLRGVEFSVRRYWTGEQVWELSDKFMAPKPATWKKERRQLVGILSMVLADGDPEAVVAELEERTPHEMQRLLRAIYRAAGVCDSAGNYLAL